MNHNSEQPSLLDKHPLVLFDASYEPHLIPFPPPPPPFFPLLVNPPLPNAPHKRTRATPEQLTILENTFNTNPSPNSRVREQLSFQLGMSERSIQIWFQNRRAKVKNQAKRSLQDIQRQTAANAALTSCQQQDHKAIDPNLYYHYYYYYLHQQQQQAITNRPPLPSSSISTPTITSKHIAPRPYFRTTLTPDLTLSASTSSSTSSITSEKSKSYRYHHHRSSSTPSSITERITTTTHCLNPYPYVSREALAERQRILNNHTAMQVQFSGMMPFDSSKEKGLSATTTITEESFYEIHPNSNTICSSSSFKQTIIGLTVNTLQIGSWKRVTDLYCQVDLSQRTLNWYLSDTLQQQSFRIVISLNLIQFIRLEFCAQYRIEFCVSSPDQVKFFMTVNDQWIQCHDFTQDLQASTEKLHVLQGPVNVLDAEFMQVLVQASELQSLIIQEDTLKHPLLLAAPMHY
ncbi:MAG: hypothetical protein EXX96DRAFT_566380 [Benjaminiella poitrasii]|nr:MAG: hypothetical protein EXX96DRAFT_566380 [Benjaminiella poitrasii]